MNIMNRAGPIRYYYVILLTSLVLGGVSQAQFPPGFPAAAITAVAAL